MQTPGEAAGGFALGVDKPAPRGYDKSPMKTNLRHFVVDVEADGPCPGKYSMIAIGAVVIEPSADGSPFVDINKGFLGYMRPTSKDFIPRALAVSGFSRIETQGFPEPERTMEEFHAWVMTFGGIVGRTCWSDNPAFDWQFLNYYFCHHTAVMNPFGYTARRIGDLACGAAGSLYFPWKRMRRTVHDHNPLNDAMGNAEALIDICEQTGIPLFPNFQIGDA